MERVYSERLELVLRAKGYLPAGRLQQEFAQTDVGAGGVQKGQHQHFLQFRMWRQNVIDHIYVQGYICGMLVEIEVTDEFKAWFLDLTVPQREAVAWVVNMLEKFGTDLPFPYSSSISGSKIAMRELRVQHMGEPYRILYVFDPARQAVLLVGGNKVGKGNRWYKSAVRLAERLYAEYLRGV